MPSIIIIIINVFQVLRILKKILSAPLLVIAGFVDYS